MYIDKNIISNGLTAEVLKRLIEIHIQKTDRYIRLKNYYKGNHGIFARKRDGEGTANIRVSANRCRFITTVATSYLIGNPVTYDTTDEYDISKILESYREQHISSVDTQLGKEASICGTGIEMVYANEDGEPRSVSLPCESAFVVYDDTAAHNKILGVYFYAKFDLNGQPSGFEATAADGERFYIFSGTDISALTLAEEREHYFGQVPFVEYLNNDEKQGDFEQQISLIDAYNTLLSDRVNDKVQFVDAFLLLLGIDITSTQAKKLKREKVLMGDTDAKAEYLSKVLNEADVEVLRKALKEDIHQTSMVPDLSDENFGNNTSGVAIKYKLLVFEQMTLDKERMFEKGLRERLELYMNFFETKSNAPIVPVYKIDVHFKRNLPANELELSQIVGNLQGIVSDKTLLSTLPFVCNAEEEAEKVAKEKAEEDRQTILTQRELMRFGGEDEL